MGTAGSGGTAATFSYASATGNGAEADSSSTNRAYIKDSSILSAGVLTVKSDSVSKAYADIDSAAFSLSVYNVEVSVTIARARGTYEAYIILPAGMAISAQSIEVTANYSTRAEAVTGTAGGVSMSLVDIGFNYAQSYADSTANCYIETGGAITTADGISVLADGSAYATANVATETVSITVANIAVSYTQAEANSTQDAYISLLSGAQVIAGGSVSVTSEYSNYVMAAVGSVGKSGFNLSAASVTVNIAEAVSDSVVKGRITGTGSLSAWDVTVLAHSDTNVYTEAVETSGLALVSIGDLEVTATAADTVYASIGGIITTTSGSIEVTAHGDAYVSGKCESGTNLSLIGVSSIDAEAYLGTSTDKQKVTAEVEENAVLTSAADIIIYAFSEGEVYVSTKNGVDLSGIEVSPFSLDATSYCLTRALINDGVQIFAAGDISIKSEDAIKQDTEISASTSIGIIYTGGTSSVDNYLNQITKTSVKNDVIILAGGSIDILSYSTADMYGSVHLNRAGLISDGDLDVLNQLVRTVTTEVLSDSTIISKLGNIKISADAGREDYLSAVADGQSDGFIGVGEVEVECNVSSEVFTTVSDGVTITSTFYTVEISAYNSAGSIYVCGDYGASGLGASPEAYADSVNTKNNATVSIGTAGSMTYITAKNIDIFTKVPVMDISTYTNAVTTGFAGTAYATSKVTLNINDIINITNAELRAYDKLNIVSSTDPMNSDINISAIANTKITAFCGHIESTAMVIGTALSSVNIGNIVTIYGADVYINAKKFAGNVSLSATGTRHAIASKDCTETYSIINLNTVSIAPAEAGGVDNVIFIIGDGSAGIVVYIDESGAVHHVGLPDEVMAAIHNNTEMTINITTSLSNNEPGSLRIYNSSDQVKVYHQDFVPYINVINESAYSIILGRMDTFNEVYSNSTVNSGMSYYFAPAMINTNPQINITSYQNTDVTLGGAAGTIGLVSTVINEKGALNISWIDTATGSLYNRKVTFNNGSETVPCVWTHELNISGALNIGTEAERFAVFMAIKDAASPVINIDATGDVYLELTLADINLSDNIDGIVEDTSPLPNSDFLLSRIASAGIVDIYLPVAIRMNYLEGASGINIVFPGIVVYTDASINLSAGTIADIERYRQLFAEDDYRYILPNGTTIYTDTDGVIMKIVTPDGSCSMENYEYFTNTSGQLIVRMLDKGITINLVTGKLTFEGISDKVSNETFELYLEFLSTLPAFNEDEAEDYWAVSDSYDVSIVDIMSLVKVEDNSITEYDFDTIAKEIFKDRSGKTYYIVWVNKNTVEGSVYDPGIDDYQIIVVDSNGYLIGAYDAERVEGTLDQNDWDQKTITLYSVGIYNHRYTLVINGVEVVVEGHFTSGADGVLIPGTDTLVSIGGSTNLVLGTDGYYYASNASSVFAESMMVKVAIESKLKSGNMQFELDYSYIGNLEELELEIKSETIDNGDDDYEIRYTYYDMKEYDLAFDSKFAVDINGIIHEIDIDGFFTKIVGDLTIAQVRGGIIYLEEDSANAVSSLFLIGIILPKIF